MSLVSVLIKFWCSMPIMELSYVHLVTMWSSIVHRGWNLALTVFCTSHPFLTIKLLFTMLQMEHFKVILGWFGFPNLRLCSLLLLSGVFVSGAGLDGPEDISFLHSGQLLVCTLLVYITAQNERGNAVKHGICCITAKHTKRPHPRHLAPR